jgi:hypothetical protein
MIDSLLIQFEPTDMQMLVSTESALWALEQLLVFAPELIGRGWQHQGIKLIIKRALHPNNVMSVRKIALRLFLIWYQTLSIYSNTKSFHDTIFQCCLPHFPLRNGHQPERILMVKFFNLLTLKLVHLDHL